MRLLVTGATGFVGSALARRLAGAGHEVYALLRPSSDPARLAGTLPRERLLRASCEAGSLARAVETARPEAAVHLAAAGATGEGADASELIEGNIRWGTLLLEALDARGCRSLVNTGTFWECSIAGDYRPFNLYAATKRAFEDVLRHYRINRGFRALTLRLFGVYGPGDWRRKVFSILKESLDAPEPVKMTEGKQTLDVVYLDDVLDAYTRAIELVTGSGPIAADSVDVGSGEPRPLREIAAAYERLAGGRLNIAWGALPYREGERDLQRAARLGPARELLGWSPRHGLEGGIARMLEEERRLAST